MNTSIKQDEKTVDYILDQAKEIWKKVKANKPTDNTQQDILLEQLQQEYKDFHSTLPLVLRTMVQMNMYSPKALTKYLLRMKVVLPTFKDRREWVRFQAEYMYYLYRENNPRVDVKSAQKYRKDIEDMLLKEDDEFKQLLEEYNKAIEAQKDKERDDLYNQLTGMKNI